MAVMAAVVAMVVVMVVVVVAVAMIVALVDNNLKRLGWLCWRELCVHKGSTKLWRWNWDLGH